MDSGVGQSHVHDYNEHHLPHNVGSQQVAHGAENQHHHDQEKKSVLRKVKDKAIKIKDTMKKHGHHYYDQYRNEDKHIPDDHHLDEEDDDQEVMAEGPEVHGAPVYDSAATKSSTLGKVENPGKPRVNFGSTSVMEEESHQEPRIVVVSPTTESDQDRATDADRTFVGEEEKSDQRMVNLERPMGLQEDPYAQGSRPEVHAPSDHETKVNDPTGAGTGEMDTAPIQKPFARMNVQDEAEAKPEPKVVSSAAETQYLSTQSHDQILSEMPTETKTQYPSAGSHDQFTPDLSSTIPNTFSENLQPEQKVMSSAAADTQHPSPGRQDHFLPKMSTANKTESPSVGSHEQFASEPIPTNPNKFPENLQEEPKVLPAAVDDRHPSVETHGQFLPEMSGSAKTQHPSAGKYDQFAPEPIPTISNKFPENLQAEPEVMSTAFDTQYPSVGSHDQFLPAVSTANETQYPSAGIHDQFASEPIPAYPSKFKENPQNKTARTVEQPHFDSTEQPSDQSNYTEENETRHEEYRSEEKPSNQSSYRDSSATTDKDVSAQNVAVSKLGYDNKDDNEMRHEEYGSWEKPSNESNYTENISPATSAIADKSVSAKDDVPSKLDYGDKGDTNIKETTSEVHKSGDAPTPTGSSAEHGKEIDLSLTEELAPVYGKVAGEGNAATSKVPATGTGATNGTTNETESSVPVQDKGVSVKDYLAEKLRPGDEDRALSEVISDTVFKRKEEPAKTLADEDRTATEVISEATSEATQKQEEEPEKEKHHLEKVTEPEEVKRRLGTEDEKSDKGSEVSYVNSPTKGMVGKLKDAVGSWFGKPGDNQSSQGDEGLSKNIDGEAGHVDRVDAKSSN